MGYHAYRVYNGYTTTQPRAIMKIFYRGHAVESTRRLSKEEVLAAVPVGRQWVRPSELCVWLGLHPDESSPMGQRLADLGFGKAKIKTRTKVQDRVWYVGTCPAEGFTVADIRRELLANPIYQS